VVPDILFPAIFDPEEVGESTLKGALIWDTIAPMQHAAYGDFAPILPELTERHLKRIQDDPDFIYLQDQLALQQQARLQKWISLNEAKRIAEREESRQRLLTIENRRREAKHMEVIGSLDELEKQKEDLDEMDEAAGGASPDDDIYAMEAAHILLDMKQLNARVAIR
jgi:carboxyl-terminal processing protease